MCIYVCMCVCLYVGRYVCTYVCMYVCILLCKMQLDAIIRHAKLKAFCSLYPKFMYDIMSIISTSLFLYSILTQATKDFM